MLIIAIVLRYPHLKDLDRGIFLENPERLTYKSLSGYMSKLLSMQDNLLKASAAELLRTDTLRLTTKELHEHTVYLPDTHVLVHYCTGSPPKRLHTRVGGEPVKVIEGRDSRYKLLDSTKETNINSGLELLNEY